MKWVLAFVLSIGPNQYRVVQEGVYPSLDRCVESSHAQRQFVEEIRGAWCWPEGI